VSTAAARPEEAPGTRAEWVDARLRAAILSGELTPGTRLRGEHLASQWGVSATPMREAFQRLAGEGWIVIEPQRGARVAAVDVDEAADYYELRLTLDPAALRSSMLSGDVRYLDEVERSYRRLASSRRGVAGLEAHREFHLTLLSRCANRQLLRLCTQLHDHTQRFQLSGAGLKRRGRPADEHRRLRDAVVSGDVELAAAVLVEHLSATLAALRP
jgi:DNA-binding GntR family transcriptional regulator